MREVDELAGPRGRSAFAAEAVTYKVKRERLPQGSGGETRDHGRNTSGPDVERLRVPRPDQPEVPLIQGV